MRCLCLMFFTFGLLLLRAEALDCTGLPIFSDARASFNSLLLSQGGEGPATFTIRDDLFFTCQAQGSTMGTYREVSVVMTFTRNSDPNDVQIRQFELDCTEISNNLVWADRSGSLSTPDSAFDYMNSLRTDCASCVTNSPPNENHCQPCDFACNSGLMRCTGTSSSDCCVAFDNGMCTDQNCTDTNFVANEQNNYICECGLTCDPGFTVNSTNCLSCFLSNICMTDMHTCQNEGQCVLVSAPDNFTCNCTGTGFTGPNCTVSPPAPSSSPTTSVTSSSSSSVSSSSPSSSSSYVSTTSSSSIPSSPTASVGSNVQEKKVFIPAIVISVIVGLLMLIVLIVLIIYTIYYFLSGKGFDMAKIKNNTPFANGESHNNPLYLKPDEVTSEVANLYTPTDP